VTGSASEPAKAFAVMDIDGVLADVRHRLHHLESRPKDWRAFFAAADADPPLAEGLAVGAELAAAHEIVYLTGRPERLRGVTQRWLRRHGLPDGRLVMRTGGDFRPARVAKLELLRSLAEERPVDVVVDDDSSVVATLLAAGFNVFHATWSTDDSASLTLHDAQERDGRT